MFCLLQVRAEELSYNGRGMDEFVVERTAAYIGQTDLHYGELTVRETLEFSARVQSTGYKRGASDHTPWQLAARADWGVSAWDAWHASACLPASASSE